jgi:hypothetical protein
MLLTITVHDVRPGAPSGADPQLWSRFAAVDSDRSGSISVRELQEALRNRVFWPS